MPLSLLKRFPLFVWLLFAGLFSVLFPPCHKQAEVVSCLGSFVQSCCGEGGALQTNVTGVCGEHSQCSGHTGFAPTCSACAFPVHTAQAPGCSIGGRPCIACGSNSRLLHKGPDPVGPVFCAFPRLSNSGSQELDERTLPGCGAPYTLCRPSLRVRRPVQRAFCLFWGAGL